MSINISKPEFKNIFNKIKENKEIKNITTELSKKYTLEYILNIVDANIDAHLTQFNVSDKLSFAPDVYQNEINEKPNIGLTFNYRF